MIKLTLLYGQPETGRLRALLRRDAHADRRANSGLAASRDRQGGRHADGAAPAFYRMAEIYFDNPEHLQRVLATPEAKKAVADLPNFASGGVTALIAQVEE